MSGQSLFAYLNSGAFAQRENHTEIASVIIALAKAAVEVRKMTTQGALNAAFAASRSERNADGDVQKDLDVVADGIFLQAMQGQPVALYGSEENAQPILIDPDRTLALAIDPLDGSSNIETNVSIGTIFSVLPVSGDPRAEPETSFLQPGTSQYASGFFIYGPQLALVLTVGSGTKIFIHSARYGDFIAAYDSVDIPAKTNEFAINASNYRHWEEPVRLYIDDCLSGAEGPRERDFNMRWIASLVADCYRILVRGGVFLYPGDSRKGYAAGRLRLVYEANPIAFLVEQAGGAATDGVKRIMEIVPGALHARSPLVFGAKREVERIARYHTDPSMISDRSPLFGHRGLFRA
ncbi:MAG: class 1 fructose-bisphosphatase [Nitratireductor sp.]|nr:class 1 fructose-bisphosphatase [Nitratireductor sp.]